MDKFSTICHNIRLIETTSVTELQNYRSTLIEYINIERQELRNLTNHLIEIKMESLVKHYADLAERKINLLGSQVVLIDNFILDSTNNTRSFSSSSVRHSG